MRQILKKLLIIFIIVGLTGGLAFLLATYAMPRWYAKQYSGPSVDLTAKPDYKILLAWDKGFGERDTIQRLKIVATKMNIDLRVTSVRPHWFVRWFVQDPVGIAKEQFKPDFLLTIQHNVKYQPGVPNYMTLTHGTDHYFKLDEDGVAQFKDPELLKFDALLPTFKDVALLKNVYERSGKKFIGFTWYPSVYATDFKPVTPQKLFYSGGFRWDTTRSSAKYLALFKKLDATGYFLVSGPKHKWKFTPHSAVGLLPNDGKSLIQAIHHAGVALVLHYQEHIDGGAPTSRIFEAAAANAVIISDRHPFIIEHFGDNVLYVDIDQYSGVMFEQIDKHMQWILANPEKAKQMADNCHRINNELYTLELQLTNLLAMHRNYVQTTKDS